MVLNVMIVDDESHIRSGIKMKERRCSSMLPRVADRARLAGLARRLGKEIHLRSVDARRLHLDAALPRFRREQRQLIGVGQSSVMEAARNSSR